MQIDCKGQGVPGPVLRYETNGLWVAFENRISVETVGGTREKIIALIVANPSITTEELAFAALTKCEV